MSPLDALTDSPTHYINIVDPRGEHDTEMDHSRMQKTLT